MRNEKLEVKGLIVKYKRSIRYFSHLISHFSPQKGFTLIEFLLVMSIFSVLAGIATVNLFSFQNKSQLNTVFNTFVADLRDQQAKAMSGDTNGTGVIDNYGIRFDAANFRYTLYKGTYSATDSANFSVSYPNTLQITTTFPSSQVNFAKGSGEVVSYASTSATITLRDTMTNSQKVIQLNRYGVISSIN